MKPFYVYCILTTRPTDHISYVLNDYILVKKISSPKFQSSILNSSREINVSPIPFITCTLHMDISKHNVALLKKTP